MKYPLLLVLCLIFQNQRSQFSSNINTDMKPLTARSETSEFFPTLSDYITQNLIDSLGIPEERRKTLREAAGAIREQIVDAGHAELIFICTHNSRRSHLSQIWAAIAADYYGVSGINTYSGGTEATAFNPRAVAALTRAGFSIISGGGNNPRYSVFFGANANPITCFSKRYDDPINPSEGFIAIMTCSDADQNCPIVEGADYRYLISYEDPKLADNTPQESARYDERCQQIGSEMFYLMSQVSPSAH